MTIFKLQNALAAVAELERLKRSQGNGDMVRRKQLTFKSVLGGAFKYEATLISTWFEACLNTHVKPGDKSKLNIIDKIILVLAIAIAKFED